MRSLQDAGGSASRRWSCDVGVGHDSADPVVAARSVVPIGRRRGHRRWAKKSLAIFDRSRARPVDVAGRHDTLTDAKHGMLGLSRQVCNTATSAGSASRPLHDVVRCCRSRTDMPRSRSARSGLAPIHAGSCRFMPVHEHPLCRPPSPRLPFKHATRRAPMLSCELLPTQVQGVGPASRSVSSR